MAARLTTAHDAETLYTRATRAELAGDFTAAFKHYVKAAEEFLHLSRTSEDAAARGWWKAEAAKALGRAEKIKARKDVAPVARDPFSEREQHFVLQKSSVVNGRAYPIWSEPGSSQRVDLAQPALSEEQAKQSAMWRNPVVDGCAVCSSTHALLPEDVSQHIVSDCSFCASIAVCIAHNRKFNAKLGVSALYPQDGTGLPVPSAESYSVKVLFNGTYRRVDINSDLPCHPDGSMMCLSTGTKRELWPALLEKAYMKLMGGYEFPGSLSTTDLYTLTGWIPEHIDIASPHFEREKTWDRLLNAFSEGRCMVTLGTGAELRLDAIGSLSLLSAHNYAVIDIQEHRDERTLTILDPWQDVPTPAAGSDVLDIGRLALEDESSDRSRVFKIAWDDVCASFDGVYLSWDPAIFSHHLSFHGSWKKDRAVEYSLPSHYHLDLCMSRAEHDRRDVEVWLLLTRHIVDTKRTGQFISLSVDGQSSAALDVLKGEYTNNTQVLVRVQNSDPILSLVASYDGLYDDVGFTVTAYSSVSLSWKTESNALPYVEKVTGAFTSKTAGGNPALPTFMSNPQYHLRIHTDSTAPTAARDRKTRIRMTLQADRHIPLNILVVWSQGQRIADFAQNDVALTSGAYNYGHAAATTELRAGDYTVIVSAFDARHLGPFVLNAECGARFELRPISHEGAGMFYKPIRGEWTPESAAGAPKFERYKQNPVYELKLALQSQVIIRLQLAERNGAVPTNVTLLQMRSDGSLGSLVATSGPYADTVCGVALGPITVQPGSYAIVPSTFNPGICAAFKLLIYTSAPAEFN